MSFLNEISHFPLKWKGVSTCKVQGSSIYFVNPDDTLLLCEVSHQYRKKITSRSNPVFTVSQDYGVLKLFLLILKQR